MIVNRISQEDYLKGEAVRKIELAHKAMTQYSPPILETAAHGLMMALEHVNALSAIEADEQRKAKQQAQPAQPRAVRGRA